MPDRVDAALLACAPRLRVVAGALKGHDNIDVAACSARGIWVTTCPDLLTAPTAELAVGLAIALLRHLPAGDALVRAGHAGWRPALYGRSLVAARVGIQGMGSVGREIAGLLSGFRCQVGYHDPVALPRADEVRLTSARVTQEALLRGSDVVFMAAPLTATSRHAIDAGALALMRPDAVLVNVGRGSVVDEDAVADALAAGRLGGYAADVFAFEDWSLPDRPRAVPAALLAQVERTVFTPHLGSAVSDVRLAIEREAALNVLAALRGERPQGAVNEARSRLAGS
jgi:phosphonate dehydrogenase